MAALPPLPTPRVAAVLPPLPVAPWKLLTIGTQHDRLLVKVQMNSLLSKQDVMRLIAQLQSFVDGEMK